MAKRRRISTQETIKGAIGMLKSRGVTLEDIAEITRSLQISFVPDLTVEECVEHVREVLSKREVAHAVMTGIALDMMAEQNLLPEPIQTIIQNDESLYGIDEIIPLAIVNVYGTIGFTNFGYLDKEKFGMIKELDSKEVNCGKVHTFLDDLVAGIAAAAASRNAHKLRDQEEGIE
jgi:phosphatidylglycerophosphatase A